MSGMEYKLKKREKRLAELETMRKFYEPLDHKQRVLNKWLKKPRR